MKKKILHASFAVVFVAMLLTPLAFVNRHGGRESPTENRMLAARPQLAVLFGSPGDFIRQFDAWFSDNIGFREGLIALHKIAKKLENNVQYTDGQYIMLIGEQGHRYFAYTDGWMIRKYAGKHFVTGELLRGLSDGLGKARQYLEEKGIPFVVMLCADKEMIYPEYYPKSIVRGPEPIELETITDHLKNDRGIDAFNIRDCLLAAKGDYPVFDKVGDVTHYNEIGAFFAYQELMKHIIAYMPEMEAFTIDDVDITYSDSDIEPGTPDVRLKRGTTYKRLDPSFFDAVPLVHPSHGVAFENEDASLPTILLMRDSYAGDGNYFSRYIPEHFGKTIMIWWSDMAYFAEYVKAFEPDVVAFESAERELGGFAGHVMGLQNLE